MEVQFLPPNVIISVFRSIDQDIIKNFKTNYQKIIIRRIIATIKKKESRWKQLLMFLKLAKAAWREVTKKTVSNCFHHVDYKTK